LKCERIAGNELNATLSQQSIEDFRSSACLLTFRECTQKCEVLMPEPEQMFYSSDDTTGEVDF
jgi:hypothetical protein